MEISPLAGKPTPTEMLIDLARIEREYYERQSDIADPDQMVGFGTSGHRGSSLRHTFTNFSQAERYLRRLGKVASFEARKE